MTRTGDSTPSAATYVPPTESHGGTRPRPHHLGLASGCTIAVGAIALVAGGGTLFVALFLDSLFAATVPMPMDWLTKTMAAFGILPLVYGIITIMAGAQLNRGEAGAYSTTMVVNILSIAFAVLSIFMMGFGLIHGVLSGIALWALSQPDMKAFFGR